MLPEPEVERLVRENTGLIGKVLKGVLAKFSTLPVGVTREDLESVGRRGLVQAAQNFDPARGVKFSTFAFQCIQNEVIGELTRAIAARPPGLCVELDALVGDDEDTRRGELEQDDRVNIEAEVLGHVESELLRSAVHLLPPVQAQIVEDVYFRQIPLADVARNMRRSPQHIQTLHARALKILRRRLHDFR